MDTGIFLLVISFILSVTTWFDDVFMRLGMKKSYVLMAIAAALALAGLPFRPIAELEINPAAVLLMLSVMLCSFNKNEYSFILSCIAILTVCALYFGLMNLIPSLKMPLISAIISAILGAMLIKRPFMSAMICVCAPFIVYSLFVITELISYVPGRTPTETEVFNSQIISLTASLLGSYIRMTLKSAKRSSEPL